ncbi:hypothetical protein ACFFKC_05680 [Pseudoduganella danionis]|uniref:Uncharacterized protein n=1 Tax=Pseudoduganella danionis TaxID=1890295 RepID=A0ABW9SQ60_9BURK|nr:hypothetical protein [Pseudoduganella danionis]MTW34307.1 hypothetical protein [Pseudoduganella danionis]
MLLLPTKKYGNSWLKIVFEDKVLFTLPKTNDPAKEIYKITNKWYRLFNPQWINPANLPFSCITRTFKYIDRAEEFHHTIDGYYHKNSYAIYGSDPRPPTCGDVVWQFDSDITSFDFKEFSISVDNADGTIQFRSIDAQKIQKFGSLIKNTINPKVTLAPPSEPGDKTIPIRSSSSQDNSCKAIFQQICYEHQSGLKYRAPILATL